LLAWWSSPAQEILAAGEFELLIAGLALVAHVGLLLRFDRSPGLLSWLGLLFTGALGWFSQPLVFPLLLPLFLVYYLTTGVKHRYLVWHLALWGVELAAVAINAWWLWDWVMFWWLRAPLPYPTALLSHRTLRTLWEAPLWGGPADRLIAGTL